MHLSLRFELESLPNFLHSYLGGQPGIVVIAQGTESSQLSQSSHKRASGQGSPESLLPEIR